MALTREQLEKNKEWAVKNARHDNLSPIGEAIVIPVYETMANLKGAAGKKVVVSFDMFGKEWSEKIGVQEFINDIRKAEHDHKINGYGKGIERDFIDDDSEFTSALRDNWYRSYKAVEDANKNMPWLFNGEDPQVRAHRSYSIVPMDIKSIKTIGGREIYNRDDFFRDHKCDYFAIYDRQTDKVISVHDDMQSFLDRYAEEVKNRGAREIAAYPYTHDGFVAVLAQGICKEKADSSVQFCDELSGYYASEVSDYIAAYDISVDEETARCNADIRMVAQYEMDHDFPVCDRTVVRDEHTGQYKLCASPDRDILAEYEQLLPFARVYRDHCIKDYLSSFDLSDSSAETKAIAYKAAEILFDGYMTMGSGAKTPDELNKIIKCNVVVDLNDRTINTLVPAHDLIEELTTRDDISDFLYETDDSFARVYDLAYTHELNVATGQNFTERPSPEVVKTFGIGMDDIVKSTLEVKDWSIKSIKDRNGIERYNRDNVLETEREAEEPEKKKPKHRGR